MNLFSAIFFLLSNFVDDFYFAILHYNLAKENISFRNVNYVSFNFKIAHNVLYY